MRLRLWPQKGEKWEGSSGCNPPIQTQPTAFPFFRLAQTHRPPLCHHKCHTLPFLPESYPLPCPIYSLPLRNLPLSGAKPSPTQSFTGGFKA